MSVDYAAKLEKVKQQQERARNKQLAKMNGPEYKESMKAKARKRTELAVEKRKAKLSDPAYKESLIAKKKAADARKLEEAKNRPPTTKRHALKKAVNKVAYRERAKTADEKRLWDELGQLPCVACLVHGKERHPVSIHHMRGRSSEMCHAYIIPLCDWHHDTPAPKEIVKLHEWMIPRHAKGSLGGKPAFEAANAKETDLMLAAYTMIGRREEALKLLAL